MYCRKCYAKLDPNEVCLCPRCGRKFDPARRRTYLDRPFPGKWAIVWYVIMTTAVSFFVAVAVALFQITRIGGPGGH
jgi:hypothetical protein